MGHVQSSSDHTPLESISRKRHDRIYGLQLDLEYKLKNGTDTVLSGFGKTVHIGSNSVRFRSDQVLIKGTVVEVAIDWPVALNEACGLKLIITGQVVDSDTTFASVKTEKYEFRTRRRFSGNQLQPGMLPALHG